MKSFLFGRKKERLSEKTVFSERICDIGNCTKPGHYQAPKKDGASCHQKPETWHWFCLEHLRTYNTNWNYFSHMNEEQIYQSWRNGVTWERPSWPLGGWHSHRWRQQRRSMDQKTSDPFGLFDETGNQPLCSLSLTPLEQKAMYLFKLSSSFTFEQLQDSYRVLVKKHHPDLHQGCRKAEETLKTINEAYALLKNYLRSRIAECR